LATRRALRSRLGWAFAALALAFQPTVLAARAQNAFDLSSDLRTITAPAPASIRVGDEARNVQAGDLLTAGELTALNQVLGSGRQVVNLNSLGAAISGNVNLVSDIARDASSLVIPRGVTALGDFSRVAALNVGGNLVNFGNLYAYSTSAATTVATINADSILNNQGALISTVLPAGSLGLTNTIASLDLSLKAVNDIANAGVITSSGSLNLVAGNQVVNALPSGATGAAPIIQAVRDVTFVSSHQTNSGVVTALQGNLDVLATAGEELAVSAQHGRFEAPIGTINIGDALSHAKANTKISGGDWHARELNINSGEGHATANFSDVSATVNVTAGGAHVYANTENLKLGQVVLTGDPTFSNTGDLTLAGSISTGGGPLALVAGGDINAGGATEISTANTSGNGGNITIVAGADFSINGSDLDINGASSTGGDVNLASLTSVSATGGDGISTANGGSLEVIAFNGGSSPPSTGKIALPSIETGGSGSGTNGNVSLIAGCEATEASISLDTINTTGGTGGGGNISIRTASPYLPDGKVTVDNTPGTGGAVTFGTFLGIINQPSFVELNESLVASNVYLTSSKITQAAGAKIVCDFLSVSCSNCDNVTMETAVSILSYASLFGQLTILEDDGIALWGGVGDLTIHASQIVPGDITMVASQFTGITGNNVTFDNSLGTAGVFLDHGISVTNLRIVTAGGDIDVSVNTSNLVVQAGGGSVTINGTGPVSLTGDAQQLLITAPSITLSGDVNVSDLLQMNTGLLVANSPVTITAPIIGITSAGNLSLEGDVTFNSSMTNLTVTGFSSVLSFGGINEMKFNGVLNAYASQSGQSIHMSGGSIASSEPVNFFTHLLVGAGFNTATGLYSNISGNPFQLINGSGRGTILNKSGDVVLPIGFRFVGQDLAILASGDVIAEGRVSSIKLSNPAGNAGDLTIIAGYDFTGPDPVGFPFPPLPFSDPNDGTYIITTPSATGGSVLMPKTSIFAESTYIGNEENVGRNAGNVTIIANGGSQSSGVIAVGSISVSSNKGVGGTVNLIGEGGVQTGRITTKGLTGGKVTISGTTPQITGGVFLIKDGVIRGSGRFIGSTPSAVNGAGIFVKGAITTIGSAVRGGDVTLASDAQVEVTGGIITSGVTTPNSLLMSAAGNVDVTSLTSKVVIGSTGINTSAFASSQLPAAGNAGNISISAGALITSGKLIAQGAANKGLGDGGHGGNVRLQTTNNVLLSNIPYNVGAIKISGFVDTRGGSARFTSNSDGGDGGTVLLSAGTVSVNGAVSGASIIASGGAKGGAGTGGAGGTVDIDTFSIQQIPASLDLTSVRKNIVKLPGGMFSIGQVEPVNGVSAKIVSNEFSFDKLTNGNGMLVTPGFSNTLIDVDVTGSNPLVGGKRVLLTPSQAIVVYQSDRGQTVNPLTINPTGQAQSGEVTFDQSELNTVVFTGFKIPNQNITLRFTGNQPILTLPSSTLISGVLDFPSANATNYINVGAGNLTVNPGAQILSNSTSKLILSGTGTTYTNKGAIIVGDLVFARPALAGLTFVSAIGSNTQVNRVLIGPNMDVGMRFTFKLEGSSNFNMPVEFGYVPLPLSYKTDALAHSSSANLLRAVVLNFSLAEISGPSLNAVVAKVGGRLTGRTVGDVTIKGLDAFLSGFAPSSTPVELVGNSIISAGKNLTVTSSGYIQIGNDVDLTAGLVSRSIVDIVFPMNIKSPGSVKLVAGGNGGVVIGSNDSITTIGNNLSIVASKGNVSIGDNNDFTVWGGNLFVLAKGIVNGSDGNSFSAMGKHNTANGGIQISSGSTMGQMSSGFSKDPYTTPNPITLLGSNVTLEPNSNGVIVLNASNGGTVDLGTAYLEQRRGAILFQSTGGTASVKFDDGTTFLTKSAFPIAFMSTVIPNANVFTFNGDEQIDTAAGAKVSGAVGSQIAMDNDGIKLFDGEIFVEATAPTSIETAHGLVEIKKGALVHVDMRNGNAHVKACGNAGDVVVYGYNHKFPIAPGQEVILTSHAPSQKDMLPADGVGRRNQETKKLEDGGHVIMSDVSLLTVISSQSALKNKPENKRVVERILKTAAALDMITRARGGYVAIPREAAKCHNNVEAPGYAASGNHMSPVSYNQQ
jgi:hypothetical protein